MTRISDFLLFNWTREILEILYMKYYILSNYLGNQMYFKNKFTKAKHPVIFFDMVSFYLLQKQVKLIKNNVHN